MFRNMVDIFDHTRDIHPLHGLLVRFAPPTTGLSGSFVSVCNEEGWQGLPVASNGERHCVTVLITGLLDDRIVPEDDCVQLRYERERRG